MRTPQQSNSWVVRYWIWIALVGFLAIFLPFVILAIGPILLFVIFCAVLAHKFNM